MFIKTFLLLLFFSFLNLPSLSVQNNTQNNSFSRFSYWKAYNLKDEGNYVLHLHNDVNTPVRDLITNLHIYIPSNSFIKEVEGKGNSIFIPSTGEYLIEISLLQLLREEGFNTSLRSHSFIYVLNNKKTKTITNLEVYKLGPAKPYLSYSPNNTNDL